MEIVNFPISMGMFPADCAPSGTLSEGPKDSLGDTFGVVNSWPDEF
jgi:hypothetical protein